MRAVPVLPTQLLRIARCCCCAALLGACSSPSIAPSLPLPEAASAAPLERPTAAPLLPAAPTTHIWSDSLAAAARKLRGELPSGAVRVVQSADQRLWLSLSAEAVFAPGRSALKPAATPWLDRVAATLRELPRSDVQIFGEPDPLSRADNASRSLALDRAESARDWLVMRGLAARRIAVAGRRAAAQAGSDEPRLDILIGERATAPR